MNRKLSAVINHLEEGFIALLLLAMTLVTFSQVVARYVFNTGAVWALELTIFLFAWLVLFGASYCVKKGVHIGIDAFVNLFSPSTQRVFGLVAVACCLLLCAILFKGSWDYIAKLHLIGIETEDLPIEEWKVKIILPVGFALLFLRFAEVGWKIWKSEVRGLHFVSEAQQAIEELGGEGDDGRRDS